MFKGLRTKIESERIQGSVQPSRQSSASKKKHEQRQDCKYQSDSASVHQESNSVATGGTAVLPQDEISRQAPSRTDSTLDKEKNLQSNDANTTNEGHIESHDRSSVRLGQSADFIKSNNVPVSEEKSSGSTDMEQQQTVPPIFLEDRLDHLTIADLKEELEKVKSDLECARRERDESNNQNALLYTLVEKLRRNMDSETEAKSNLETKVIETEEKYIAAKSEAESAKTLLEKLQQQQQDEARRINNADKQDLAHEIDGDTNGPVAKLSQVHSDECKNYRDKIEELTKQLSEKNKMIRLKQQNLNDLKKAFQKEMLEHSKTQRQLNLATGNRNMNYESLQSSSSSAINNHNPSQINHHYNCTNLPVDPSSSAPCSTDITGNHNHYFNSAPLSRHQTTLSLASHDGSESPSGGTMTPQLDRLSCRSRSSVSVSDFDANDMTNKEVSHEYLRNVLYRYMTSTDKEKAQHLVKAISVLMNFSPEQCSAIKSAMNSRSSWLRLR